MLDNIQVVHYLQTNNCLNDFHSFSRLIFMLILSIIIGISDNIIVLLFLVMLIFILIFLSKIPKKKYLKGIANIKLLLILTFVTTWLFHNSLSYAGIMTLKFIILVLLGSIYLYTTKLKDMVEGIRILISPLQILKVNCNDIALIILLTIRFIPVVIEQAKRMVKSLQCRGLNYYGSIVNRIKVIPIILYPIIIKSIYQTIDFSDALLMRSVEEKNNQKLKIDNWNIRDTFITVLSFITLLYIIRNEVFK